MSADPAELKQRIARAIASQQQPTIGVLSSLLAVEDEVGYISKEGVEAVAEATGATINDVWGVASFYTNFRFDPQGTHRIEVCWGSSCHLLGASRIAQEVLQAIGLEKEGNTADGRFSFHFNTCLGACSHGPVMSVDHRLKGRLTPNHARELLLALMNGATPQGHA